MRRVAFLTSGGDCQALNATMRGVAKTLYNADPDTQIIGILEGYKGLMYEKYVEMKPLDFSLTSIKVVFISSIDTPMNKFCSQVTKSQCNHFNVLDKR